jgi:hypothetical protein
VKPDIGDLVSQIRDLEDRLREALHEQETRIHFRIDGRRVHFEMSVLEGHRRARVGLLRWFGRSNLRNAASAPFIYALIVPLVFLDLLLTLYQAVCFRLYRIPRVPRERYIVIDRHHLGYLNILERLNCAYCGYANGLLAYAREIAARTEQYWCPIKHARRVLGSHARYARFLDYGDATDYETRLARLRQELREEEA